MLICFQSFMLMAWRYIPIFQGFSRTLTQDGQLRWIGPEKGVLSMACGAILNGVSDNSVTLMLNAVPSLVCGWRVDVLSKKTF